MASTLDLSTCKTFKFTTHTTDGCLEAFSPTGKLTRHGIALVGHLIYLIGGDANMDQRGVYALDTNTLVWTQVSRSLNILAQGQKPVLVGDKLYSFGLPDRTELRSSVLCFDIVRGEVEPCECEGEASLLCEGSAREFVEAIGLVVMHGGASNGDSYLPTTRRVVGFDVASRKCEEIEVKGGRPPVRRFHSSCVHGMTDVFFFGGNPARMLTPCPEIYHLNCANGRFVWNEVDWSPLPVARANSVMYSIGSRVYIYGGYPTDGTRQSDELYIFDLKDRTAVEISHSSGPQITDYHVLGNLRMLALHAAVATNDKIFILGGRTSRANAVSILSAEPE